jgi:hypothetical protein
VRGNLASIESEGQCGLFTAPCTACMRKLLTILNAMVRDLKAWEASAGCCHVPTGVDARKPGSAVVYGSAKPQPACDDVVQTPASSSTTARAAANCCDQSRETAACSVRSEQCRARLSRRAVGRHADARPPDEAGYFRGVGRNGRAEDHEAQRHAQTDPDRVKSVPQRILSQRKMR